MLLVLAKKQPAAFTSVFVRDADDVRESTKSVQQHGVHTGTAPRATPADHWEAAACGMFAAAFSVRFRPPGRLGTIPGAPDTLLTQCTRKQG